MGYGDQIQPDIPPQDITQGGRWVRRDKNVHRCQYPHYQSDVKVGDIWQCTTCYKRWEVTKIDTGSQRDPISPPVFRWREVTEYQGIVPR